MKNKFLIAILCLGLLTVYYACEKDDALVKEEQVADSPTTQITPTIKTVSYEDAGETFNRLKNQYQLDGFLDTSLESNVFSRSTLDTLGITIYTDNIKEVTAGDYTSYTMLIATPSTTESKFYNLTIEDKDGEAGMFVTKYVPTQAWLDDKNKAFEGSISTQSKDSFTTVGIDDGGGTNDDSPDIHYSEYYPDDCDGWVNETTVIAEYSCGCGHWPGDSTCQGCTTNEPQWAGYAYVTTYECIPYDTSNPNDNGTDTSSTNSGGVTNDAGPNNGDGSIAVLVRDEDEPCEPPYSEWDINEPYCFLDDLEICYRDYGDGSICDCVANGGNLTDCIFEENISIEQLTNECANSMLANNLLGTTDESVYTNLLNKIRDTFFNDPNVILRFKNSDGVPNNANAATAFDEQSEIDSGTYEIVIGVSNTYLNGDPTKLSIALTLIHEMVHAKLMYAYLHGTLLTEYPEYTNLQNSFDTFMDNRTTENGLAMNDASHVVMVDFIGDMSYALFKYAEKVGMENITQQYCTDIVKGSFYNTPAMDLIDTGDNTPEDLNNMSFNEQDNNENAQGDDC